MEYSRKRSGDKIWGEKKNARKIRGNLDDDLKKAIIRGTNNQQMIKGHMKIVINIRKHLDELHKMMDW